MNTEELIRLAETQLDEAEELLRSIKLLLEKIPEAS